MGTWADSPPRVALPLLLLAGVAGCRASPADAPGASVAPGELAAGGAEEAEPGEGATTEDEPKNFGGSLSTRYRGRFTGGARDHDVYELLTLDFGDPRSSELSGHVMTQITADVDGRSDSDGDFFSLNDTYDSSVTARLYHAYVDVHEPETFEVLRLGRQLIYETPEVVYFDGARVETVANARRGTRLGMYGGLPVYPFESSPAGDALFGAFAETRPWKLGRVRLDWMHLEDENLLGKHRDDLFAVELWQRVGEKLRLKGRHSRLEDDPRDVRLRGDYYDPESDLTFSASYYELLTTQKDLSVPLDPFFSTLFEHFPFYQTTLLASKGFGERFAAEGGMDLRRVLDADDIGQFNRDFERYYSTLTFSGPTQKVNLSVTGELWDSPDSKIRTIGADLSQEFDERWRGSLGTYYSLFKYELYLNEERDDVRTYYLRVRFKRTEATTFDLHYEFEDDDLDRFHVLRLGMAWRF